MSAASNTIIEIIVDQHFEEASFLWSQRDAAVTAPNYLLEDLADLDERVEAHIDGLRVAGDYGWALCEAALDADEPGTIFTGSIIAFESGDKDRIDQVIGVGSKSRAAFRGMVSGLGWLDDRQFNSIIGGLVRANSASYRSLGIAACGIRRADPKSYLESAIQDSDLFLKARALKAVGELKRQDLLPQLRDHFQHEDHACRFAAAWSALLLGDRSALDTMSAFVHSRSAFTLPAIKIALRIVDGQTARIWLKALSKNPEQRREVLIGTGITGDPDYVPSLIKQMEKPQLARAAGEAFSMITGVDLAYEDLENEWPEGFEAGPNDDPEDEDVEMDADEDLPWPDAAPIQQWWEQHKGEFGTGTRYLAGSPVSPEHCTHVLKNGMQRQRNAAALELALSQPDAPYFNTKAPGIWQVKRM